MGPASGFLTTPRKGKGFGFFKGGSALKRPAKNSDTSAIIVANDFDTSSVGNNIYA